MKVFIYSVLTLTFSVLATMAHFDYSSLETYFPDRYFPDQMWHYHHNQSAIQLGIVLWSLFFAIVTYFVILRRHAAKRRKVMAPSYGQTTCPVMADFDEAVKMLARADYGVAPAGHFPPQLPAAEPPPLPLALSADQAADGIRVKLVSLQRMKEEGLITEEEYTTKKAELLHQL